jgi:hypothetical protein
MHHTRPCVRHLGGGWYSMAAASTAWGTTWEMALYGSSGHHMGARCSHHVGGWCQRGFACPIWEPRVPYGSQMGAMCSR